MRRIVIAGALVSVAACSSGTAEKHPAPPVPPPLPGNEAKLELPAIPARIEVTTSTPTDTLSCAFVHDSWIWLPSLLTK